MIDSEEYVEIIYVDGIMRIYEVRTKCSTPIKESDICIEKVFIFIKKDEIHTPLK